MPVDKRPFLPNLHATGGDPLLRRIVLKAGIIQWKKTWRGDNCFVLFS